VPDDRDGHAVAELRREHKQDRMPEAREQFTLSDAAPAFSLS